MTFMKWPITLSLLAAACIHPTFSRGAETAAQPTAGAETNLIQNGSFTQWREADDATPSAGFVQRAPVAWRSRTHALTLREGKPGTKPSDYTYKPDSTARGVQPIGTAPESLVIQAPKPEFAYRVFQEFAIQPGTYVFSGGLGVTGRTSALPSTAKFPGDPIPWKITLELMDGSGQRVSLTTLTTVLPTGSGTTPDATKFKPATVTVPDGAAKASFSIWCYGGDAYGHIDELKLVKQP